MKYTLLNFDKSVYQTNILNQKKEKLPYILTKVESARKTYEEFKTDIHSGRISQKYRG